MPLNKKNKHNQTDRAKTRLLRRSQVRLLICPNK